MKGIGEMILMIEGCFKWKTEEVISIHGQEERTPTQEQILENNLILKVYVPT